MLILNFYLATDLLYEQYLQNVGLNHYFVTHMVTFHVQ